MLSLVTAGRLIPMDSFVHQTVQEVVVPVFAAVLVNGQVVLVIHKVPLEKNFFMNGIITSCCCGQKRVLQLGKDPAKNGRQ